MKGHLHSQSSSVYSLINQDQQIVRVKTRTNEDLELSLDKSSPTNIQLHISDMAEVRLKIHTGSPSTILHHLECFLSKGSKLYIDELYTMTQHISLKVHLTEPYASVNINTRIKAQAQHNILLKQYIFHHAGYTHANIDARAVIFEKSKANIETTLRVEVNSRGCTSLQNLSALQTSSQAKVNAVPCLEIYNSDVITKHGVSIRTIRPDEIWFLQTKGVPQDRARDMIVEGFISEI
jgi:hypothetical protein